MLPSLLSKVGFNSQSRRRKEFKRESDQRPSTSPYPTSQFLAEGSRLSTPLASITPSGYFAGASNVDASHGVFTDVTGDHNIINIGLQDNAPDPSAVLNKLPRAEDAGYQYANHGICLDGTRTAELRRIEEWEVDNTAKPIYWLRGVPGSGKSTIARTLAKLSSEAGRLGATFFCSRDFTDRRNIRLIFPTLAYYLALLSPEFRAALAPIIGENPHLLGRDTLDLQFDKLLVRPLQSMETRTTITIIIDALDECEDNQPASAILFVLGRYIKSIPWVKFFITGRPELSIRKGFGLPSLAPHTETFLLHEVDRGSVDHDIELYLTTGLSEIVKERSHWDLTVPWPTDKDITVTIEKCSGLFIVASVIVKFVSSRHHEPRERLKIIISRPNSTVHEGRSGIDTVYYQVLLHSFEDIRNDETGFFVHLRLVVGSVVVAFNPLSCASLATIFGITMSSVWTALRSLHSIFIVPDSEFEPIRVCHKCLADYLTDKTRCTDSRFYINPSVVHLELGLHCLQLMNGSLKKNICEFPRYVMNSDIDDLDGRREKYIGGGLEYGCRFWAMHLRLGSKEGEGIGYVAECLKEFFERYLLAWLEVLSIVGDLRSAVYSLHDVAAWVVYTRLSDTNLSVIISDSENFVLQFFDGIESSAPHIYESALPSSPSSSLVRALYREHASTDVKISVIDDSWDACVRTLRSQDDVWCIEFSHKDDLIALGKVAVVEILETATGQRQTTLTTDSPVWSLAFSSDDTILVTGHYYHGRVNVWDLQTGSLFGTLEGHSMEPTLVAFSPCENIIAISFDDRTVQLWSASSLDCRGVLEGHPSIVRTICWSATGREIISGSEDATVKIWNIADMTCSKTLTIHTDAVTIVVSSAGSPLIASASIFGTVKVFDTESGDVLHTFETNLGHINRVRFLDRDHLMYAAGSTFIIRDLDKGFDALTFQYEGEGRAISSDGICLVSSYSAVGVVKIWQTNSMNRIQDAAGHHTGGVRYISFSDDGRLIASGSADDTLKIWDTSTGLCLNTFHDHSNGVDVVSFSSDLTLCSSWGLDDAIRIWDIHTGSQVSTCANRRDAHVWGICFSPNGSQLVSVGSYNIGFIIDLWEVTTGGCLASVTVESELKYRNISFDVDGTSIILRLSGKTHRWRLSPTPTTHSHESDSYINLGSGWLSDGSSVHGNTRGHKSSIHDANNPDYSLQLAFVPVNDTDQPVPAEDVSPRYQYHLESGSPWVVDNHQRRVFWVPPDLACVNDSYGNKVVFGSISGRVTIVYFSDVDQHTHSLRID